MNQITNEPMGFQQTQSTRVKDPGPATNANPPPPPPKEQVIAAPVVQGSAPSPHPHRGQSLNVVA